MNRKHPAHPAPVTRFNLPTILFVTVCARDHRPVFANPAVHRGLVTAWEQTRQWRVGRYLIMPDHVHFFCTPGVLDPEPVRTWCGLWKRLASKTESSLRGHWLRDVWDTQIRDRQHYLEKINYMEQNPVRKELTARAEDWPYQGVIAEIRW